MTVMVVLVFVSYIFSYYKNENEHLSLTDASPLPYRRWVQRNKNCFPQSFYHLKAQ